MRTVFATGYASYVMDNSPNPRAGGQHYFSSKPHGEFKERDLHVRLAGKDLKLVTGSGIFSPGHLDIGTGVLLRKAPDPPASGNLLDIGCGWGPIALTMALSSPAAHVWAIDVNERALQLTRRNATLAGVENITVCHPDDVPKDLKFTGVWSNPPVRIGKPALQGLVLQWLGRLTLDGAAWLVIQRHLGADSLHRWLETQGWDVERAGSAKGFRVLYVAHKDARDYS